MQSKKIRPLGEVLGQKRTRSSFIHIVNSRINSIEECPQVQMD